jgi:dihydropteroate synthase
MSSPCLWTGRRFHFDLTQKSLVMGICNVTPDSFSENGLHQDAKDAVAHGLAMAKAGADIIDIGGESTRPGAPEVSVSEELNRILPVLGELAEKVEIPLCVDTTKAEVADAALKAGASIVNDISGLTLDPNIAHVVADHGAGLVLMHMRGTPRTMQKDTHYDDIFSDIIEYLQKGIHVAQKAGVDMERIVIDPGIGFGKSAEQNMTIIRELDFLAPLGRPILMGLSRKSFLGAITGRPAPERIEETIAATLEADRNGARIHRVHDVSQAVIALQTARAIRLA